MPSDIWTSTVSSNLARLICFKRAMACLSGGAPALAIFCRSFLSLLRSFLPRRGGRPGCRPFFLTGAAGAAVVAATGAATGEGATGGAGSPAAAGAFSPLGALALEARGFFACRRGRLFLGFVGFVGLFLGHNRLDYCSKISAHLAASRRPTRPRSPAA